MGCGDQSGRQPQPLPAHGASQDQQAPAALASDSKAVVARPWWQRHALLIAIAALGVVLRGAAWNSGRNLWTDEAMLALNLLERDPAGLTRPLDWNQGAPIGFLLAAKSVIIVFGDSELSLRLVPFLGSVYGLVGFAWLALRVLPRPAALLALGLFSLSPSLVSYAGECKQYSTDAAVAVGLLAASVGLLEGGGGIRRWAILAAGGAAAVWFSHPSAFVLGGVGSALLLESCLRKDRKRIAAGAACVAAWVASFACCYILFLRKLGDNNYLLAYWDGHFLPLPPRSAGDLAWLVDHYFALFSAPGIEVIPAAGLAGGLFLVGIAGLARRRRSLAIALVMPGFLALLASGIHRYPFAGRLLLFLVPLLIIGVAHGAGIIGSVLHPKQPFAALLFVGILLASPAMSTFKELQHPERTEQIEPFLRWVREDWQPEDQIYVYYGAIPAFRYYTRNDPFPDGVVSLGTESRGEPAAYRNQLLALRGRKRVWLVFSHRHKGEEALIVAHAESLWKREKAMWTAGASAFLFVFSSEK